MKIRGFFCLAAAISLGLPQPAFALRTRQPTQNSQLEEDIADALGYSPVITTAGLEEVPERLKQLSHLQGITGKELRQSLWEMPLAADPPRTFWTRETLLQAIRTGEKVIQATGIPVVQSPWGEVNLNWLDDPTQYPPERAAYLIARDIEIAIVLGLVRV